MSSNFSQFFRNKTIPTHVIKAAATLFLSTLPISLWYYHANQERQNKLHSVATQVKISSVQTIDELMIENFQAGDIILFDRRCYTCSYSPFSSLGCILCKSFLCDSTAHSKPLEGSFEHAGILVPSKKESTDPMDLLLLETTASEGIISRPLLQRLQSSQSRSILILPLYIPGERRTDDSYNPSPKTLEMKQIIHEKLYDFSKTWISISQKQNYQWYHTSLTIFGSLVYVLNLHTYCNIPVNPSAWLITLALMDINAIRKGNETMAMHAKVHDFTKDERFLEENENKIQLRPGWKFGRPMVIRET